MPNSILTKTMFIILLPLFLSGVLYAQGEPVTAETAKRVAENYSTVLKEMWFTVPAFWNKEPTASRIVPLLDLETNQPLGYVVELKPQGYIVTSARTDIHPIIAFSFRENFPWEETPENIVLDMLRTDLRLRNQALPEMESEHLQGKKSLWQERMSVGVIDTLERFPPTPSPGDWADGWIPTRWSQGSVYNQLCPLRSSDTTKRCATGCVATAMSQIVNYWARACDSLAFTPFDTTTDRYTSTRNDDTVHIDQDSALYDFPSFYQLNAALDTTNLLHYSYPLPLASDLYNAPVLSFACGVGAKMNYSGSSSSTAGRACNGFQNKFNLDCITMKPATDSAAFYDTLTQNMKKGKPVLLTVFQDEDEESGHAIIADGYMRTSSDEVFYHLNYGWGGGHNGWYQLPSVMYRYDVVGKSVLNISPR